MSGTLTRRGRGHQEAIHRFRTQFFEDLLQPAVTLSASGLVQVQEPRCKKRNGLAGSRQEKSRKQEDDR